MIYGLWPHDIRFAHDIRLAAYGWDGRDAGRRGADPYGDTASSTTLMLKTTIKEKGESSPVTLLDEDVFFSSDEVKAYLKNNQNRTFSYVSLGFDVETNVPLRFAKDLAVAVLVILRKRKPRAKDPEKQ